MYLTIKSVSKGEFDYFITHADSRYRQISPLVDVAIYITNKFITVSKQFALDDIAQRHSDPSFFVEATNLENVLGRKNLDFEYPLGGDIDDKLVLLDGEIEKDHIFVDVILYVEFKIEVETFRKRPFNIAIDHLDTCLPSISDKIVAGFLLHTLLLFEYISQQKNGELQNSMIIFFFVKVFDQHRQNGFDDFAIDGVGVGEGYYEIRNLFALLDLRLKAKNKVDYGLKDRMIDLYYLFVSFPQDKGVESIATVDLAKFFED